MRNQLGLGILGTAGLGAALMFLLDPDMGKRRRAILRDKLSLTRLSAWAADKTGRGVKTRLYGTLQSTKSRFVDTPITDDVLVERLRSKMGPRRLASACDLCHRTKRPRPIVRGN